MNEKLINDFATNILASIHNNPEFAAYLNMASGNEWDEAVWVAKELIGKAPRQHIFHPETGVPFCGEENPDYVAARDGDESRSVPTCTRCAGKGMKYLNDKLKVAEAKVERVSALATGWDKGAGPDSVAGSVFGPQKMSVKFAVKQVRDALAGVAS